ncbi:MAG TPA: hypothetical protein PKC26_09360 [Plasticicumulans sp.]|uniref:hypothetical protein n=1 Tax=Plasticicumulans sp. TaxID=2307179 RepID=UPI002C853AF4|nr:hypothetical protein [Plasticicumulans sp.]HNI23892.1 hypothetical protein [Plasticicumulans sp.]
MKRALVFLPLLTAALGGCYEPPGEVVLHRPHAYKGKDDALRTVLTDPAFAERLRARQRAVQDVRIAGLKEAAL